MGIKENDKFEFVGIGFIMTRYNIVKKIKKRKIIILVVLLILIMVSWVIWGNLSVETNQFTATYFSKSCARPTCRKTQKSKARIILMLPSQNAFGTRLAKNMAVKIFVVCFAMLTM